MATAPSSDEGAIQDVVTFSPDDSCDDSDSSSSSTSTFDGDEDDYSRLGLLMESVRVKVKQDPAAVINAEKMKLNKKIEKFGVKKLEYETEMAALVKTANDLTEQDKKLKEERDALTSLKAARLGESQKKITELKCEISGLKGKIQEVQVESYDYNENHKAIMTEISHVIIADEPLFRVGGTMMNSYTNNFVEMEKSSKDLASLVMN